jgi:NAD(P)H-dependent FMN reductase
MESQTPLHVAVIIGSTREGRLAPHVATWFTDRADQRTDLALDVIDLADADLPYTMTGHGQPRPAEVEAFGERLARADAFVVITPEYNHSFPAPLKNAIDWYVREWANKPVAFVCYGGISGGLRAVQQLRQVFIELQASPIREVVSFHDIWSLFDTDGSWPKPSEQRDDAAKALLDQLAWWGTTLREGRSTLAVAA